MAKKISSDCYTCALHLEELQGKLNQFNDIKLNVATQYLIKVTEVLDKANTLLIKTELPKEARDLMINVLEKSREILKEFNLRKNHMITNLKIHQNEE
jgi:hypothetical protein